MILYHIYGYAIPVIILATLYGFRWKVGMWGNSLSLGAVLFSFLVAVGWWESLAELLAQQVPKMLFLADGVAFWAIFVLTLSILDAATRFVSTVKVKFADSVENAGNGIILFLLFAVLYGTFLFAEELGPVGANLNDPEPGNSAVISLLRILSSNEGMKGNLATFTEGNQFDGSGNHRQLHLQRRQAIMLNMLGDNGSILFEGDTGNLGRNKK